MKVRFLHRRYRLPLRMAVRTAHGVWMEREGVVVRLEDEQGNVGLGEAAPIPWFGTETVDEVERTCRILDEWGEDERFLSIPAEFGCLRHAVECARQELGGAGREVISGPDYLGLAALLPAGVAALAEIEAKSEAGFRVFKWKVGVADLADELGLLDDICAGLPDGAKLRLDANGAWDRRQAERWLERCAERPVEFIEQPIAPDARGAADLLRGLAEDYPTAIALDESLIHGRDIERWVGEGWPGVFVVKLSLVADVATALSILATAKADVVFSSGLETAIGAKEALRHAFAWTGSRRALAFGVWPLFENRRFDGPHLAPFLRREDVGRIDVQDVWNALN